MKAKDVQCGDTVTVLNRQGKELARGEVIETERHWFSLREQSGETASVSYRNVVSFGNGVVKLNVTA